MGGERRQGMANMMEAWQQSRERRIQALEAENQELRRQLDELRRGVGVAVVIAGRAIPLASAVPAATHPIQPAPPDLSLANVPTTHTLGSPAAPAQRAPQRRGSDDSWLTGEHPRASAMFATPAPAPRPPAVSRAFGDEAAWLRSGASWPEPAATPSPTAPIAPIGPLGHAFPAPPPPPDSPHVDQSPRPRQPGEPNVFADSFIL